MVTTRLQFALTRYASAAGERRLHPCAIPSRNPLQTREVQRSRLRIFFSAGRVCLAIEKDCLSTVIGLRPLGQAHHLNSARARVTRSVSRGGMVDTDQNIA